VSVLGHLPDLYQPRNLKPPPIASAGIELAAPCKLSPAWLADLSTAAKGPTAGICEGRDFLQLDFADVIEISQILMTVRFTGQQKINGWQVVIEKWQKTSSHHTTHRKKPNAQRPLTWSGGQEVHVTSEETGIVTRQYGGRPCFPVLGASWDTSHSQPWA